MNKIRTSEFVVEIKPQMNIRGERFSIHYDSGEFEKIHVEPMDGESFELATARPVNNSLVLYHLQVPEPYQGIGFGKLGLALFYYILNVSNYNKYAIKFGGGEKSAGFLGSLGFSDEYIHTAQDSDFVGDSVMFGEFSSTGERPYDWRLDPVPISTFPRSFFKFS